MLYTPHYITDLFLICKIQRNIIKDEMHNLRHKMTASARVIRDSVISVTQTEMTVALANL